MRIAKTKPFCRFAGFHNHGCMVQITTESGYMVLFGALKALTEIDETLLRGREAVVREIVQNCRAGRFTVVTAEAGMGVSSLLEAGVAPALKTEGAIVATFREWQGRFVGT